MSGSSWFRWWMVPAAIPIAGLAVCSLGFLVGGPCGGLYWQYGIWESGSSCPVGKVRAGGSISAYNLLRGSDEGRVSVHVEARWMARGEDGARQDTAWRGTSARLELLNGDEVAVQGFVAKEASRDAAHQFEVTLPADLPDGDYVLRATIGISGEELVVDAALPLYAPALSHVSLDRPLYEPGNEVRLRSVLLRRTDQAPLPGRPGRWEIRDAQGVVVHAEKDVAGPWGIADSTFYLASDAVVGTWSATWRSADASDTVQFDVRPFTLPRFTVEAKAEERWFHPGERLSLTGTARYTSGAPVIDAPVTVNLGVAGGSWPLPVAWERPYETRTDAQGRFELELGQVPKEKLLERELAKLGATVRVTDETGETQVGGATLVISADDVRAEVLTELEGGLVEGVNNRAWVRVSTPDGVPVRGSDLVLGNPFDEGAKGYTAKTDADGVAVVQLDPGAPISVPMPPSPVRIRPRRPDAVSLTAALVLPDNRSPSLPERRSLDALHASVAQCGDFVKGALVVPTALKVDASGRVAEVQTDPGLAAECVAKVMRGARFPAGEPRVVQLSWRVPDTLLPTLSAQMQAGYGSPRELGSALQTAALRARRCLGRNSGRSGATVLKGTWSLGARPGAASYDLVRTPGSGLNAREVGCVQRELLFASVSSEGEQPAMGGLTVMVQRMSDVVSQRPQATFTTGYPLGVVASADGSQLGKTLAVVGVGSVPPLRIRMTPSLPSPGDEVTVDFLRSADFYGTFPEKVHLKAGSVTLAKQKLPTEGKRTVTFKIPEDARGFLHVETHGARGVVFVRDPAPLSVALSTDQAEYAPGDRAVLTVTTKAGQTPTPAAVGLSGVDETLGQLATLLGPNDMGRVTVRASSDAPAFGAFDARALALGQIRGDNAATAAVMSLSSLPMDAAGDVPASASGTATVDDLEVVTRRFWRARAAVVDRVRDWEGEAPQDQLLTHARMAELWDQTVDALEAGGTPTRDAFDRKLTLDNLPRPLLARLDPREVAADSTRLPEDVTSWPDWVQQEVR